MDLFDGTLHGLLQVADFFLDLLELLSQSGLNGGHLARSVCGENDLGEMDCSLDEDVRCREN